MSYTLWRGNTQVGETFGEVQCSPIGTISGAIEMGGSYVLPSGFVQWNIDNAGARELQLMVFPENIEVEQVAPERCRVHSVAGEECFQLREYKGPIESPSADAAYALRDSNGDVLDVAMLQLHDSARFFARLMPSKIDAPMPALAGTRFRISAILRSAVEEERPTS